MVAIPVRWASRSSSERRNAGPPERPSTTAQPGPAVGGDHHLDGHLPPALGHPVVLAGQQPGPGSGIHGRARPSNARGRLGRGAPPPTRPDVADSTTAQPLWNTRGSSAASSFAAASSAVLASASSSSSSRWVSSGPANGRSASTSTPGHGLRTAVIRLSGSRSRGSSTTTSSTATPLPRSRTSTETMSMPACRARWRRRPGCRAGRAPPGAGDRTRFLRVVGPCRVPVRAPGAGGPLRSPSIVTGSASHGLSRAGCRRTGPT